MMKNGRKFIERAGEFIEEIKIGCVKTHPFFL